MSTLYPETVFKISGKCIHSFLFLKTGLKLATAVTRKYTSLRLWIPFPYSLSNITLRLKSKGYSICASDELGVVNLTRNKKRFSSVYNYFLYHFQIRVLHPDEEIANVQGVFKHFATKYNLDYFGKSYTSPLALEIRLQLRMKPQNLQTCCTPDTKEGILLDELNYYCITTEEEAESSLKELNNITISKFTANDTDEESPPLTSGCMTPQDYKLSIE